jgi:HSP20 family protein
VGRRSVTKPGGTAVYRESRDFDYRRVFELDPSIDTARINARLENGILKVHLPKTEAVKPRRITVSD